MRQRQVVEEAARRNAGRDLPVTSVRSNPLPVPKPVPVPTPQENYEARRRAEEAKKFAEQVVDPQSPVNLPFEKGCVTTARQNDFDHRLRMPDRLHLPAPCSVEYYKRNATYLDAMRLADMRSS